MCAISFYYYYYFQNSGAPNDVFPLNALKTLFKAVQPYFSVRGGGGVLKKESPDFGFSRGWHL